MGVKRKAGGVRHEVRMRIKKIIKDKRSRRIYFAEDCIVNTTYNFPHWTYFNKTTKRSYILCIFTELDTLSEKNLMADGHAVLSEMFICGSVSPAKLVRSNSHAVIAPDTPVDLQTFLC